MIPKILIIDDEIDFCFLVTGYLRKKGFEVSFTHSLQEGVKMAMEMQPQILFLDNNLPDGHGWDWVGKFVEIIPRVNIYLISAHRDKSTFSHDYKNIQIWEKPISLTALDTISLS